MSKVAWLWPAWIGVTLALTTRPYLWHLEYFRRLGPQFLWFYLGALALLGVPAYFYLRRRETRPRWIANEPRAFFGFFLGFLSL